MSQKNDLKRQKEEETTTALSNMMIQRLLDPKLKPGSGSRNDDNTPESLGYFPFFEICGFLLQVMVLLLP
jgi:hypothetical protein